MNEAQHSPVAGQDYPQTWSQFEDWFSSESDCQRYLERLRWPEGFMCPRCECRDGHIVPTGRGSFAGRVAFNAP